MKQTQYSSPSEFQSSPIPTPVTNPSPMHSDPPSMKNISPEVNTTQQQNIVNILNNQSYQNGQQQLLLLNNGQQKLHITNINEHIQPYSSSSSTFISTYQPPTFTSINLQDLISYSDPNILNVSPLQQYSNQQLQSQSIQDIDDINDLDYSNSNISLPSLQQHPISQYITIDQFNSNSDEENVQNDKMYNIDNNKQQIRHNLQLCNIPSEIITNEQRLQCNNNQTDNTSQINPLRQSEPNINSILKRSQSLQRHQEPLKTPHNILTQVKPNATTDTFIQNSNINTNSIGNSCLSTFALHNNTQSSSYTHLLPNSTNSNQFTPITYPSFKFENLNNNNSNSLTRENNLIQLIQQNNPHSTPIIIESNEINNLSNERRNINGIQNEQINEIQIELNGYEDENIFEQDVDNKGNIQLESVNQQESTDQRTQRMIEELIKRMSHMEQIVEKQTQPAVVKIGSMLGSLLDEMRSTRVANNNH